MPDFDTRYKDACVRSAESLLDYARQASVSCNSDFTALYELRYKSMCDIVSALGFDVVCDDRGRHVVGKVWWS